MQQQTRALQMAQKLVAQTGAFGRAFDQTGHVGDDKTLLGGHAHHAQIRVQGGERVVGDLGAGVGDGADQGGFTGVGHAQQSDIGQHFEFEL